MPHISKHFKREEFACQCQCGFDTVDAVLLEALEALRELTQSPISINSAARCLKHNRAIGSNDTSQHVLAKAADIVVTGYSPAKVYQLLDSMYPERFGIGEYETFVHIDSRDNKARWKG